MQVNMPVQDIEQAARFYGDVLGLPLLGRRGDLAFFRAGHVRLLVERAGEAGGRYGHPGSVLYFRVDDLDAAVALFRERGVNFVEEPAMVSRNAAFETWMAFFDDGQWNTHALVAEVPLK